MIHEHLLLVLSLLIAVAGLQMLSVKLRISFPILLVLGGLAVSFVPGLPAIRLQPDVVFLLFLPPLLYEAAWFTSLSDFVKLRRAILAQAFGLVLITSVAVAFIAHDFVPGMGWALGFLLGGVVAPPDAVAAASVLHGMRVPKSALTVLEGESLINDASSLIIFRFALAAVVTGSFSLGQAASQLGSVMVFGVLIGLVLAQVAFLIHRFLPSTPSTDSLLTLLTPYVLYLGAEQFHTSGVLAVVAGGLYLSARSHRFLSPSARVQANGVWGTFVFLLNGLVFILLGLQLPFVVRGLGETSLASAIGYGLLISAVVIVVRLVWVFVVAYARSILGLRRGHPHPPWKMVFLIGFAGMRGVVSLASALAVPLMLPDKSPFPQRNLLVFITFVVILATLVGQGLALPFVVRWLRFEDDEQAEHDEARRLDAHLADAALRHLRTQGLLDHAELTDEDRTLIEHLAAELTQRGLDEGGEHRTSAPAAKRHHELRMSLIALQRAELEQLRCAAAFGHEVLRHKSDALDLELAAMAARHHA